MGRRPTGSLFVDRGSYFVRLTLKARRAFRIGATDAMSRAEAEARKQLLVSAADKLRKAGHMDQAESIIEVLADAEGERLAKHLALVDAVADGRFYTAPAARKNGMANLTFREFANLWTSGELARRYPNKVKVIKHDDNRERLEKHVFPVVLDGMRIADVLVVDFTLEHAQHVLAQPTVPAGSYRHIAQVINRVITLAVTPAMILKTSPLPPRWMPTVNRVKEGGFLLADEEAQLMACKRLPLIRRVLFGFLAREGLRAGNAAQLTWDDLKLDWEDSAGGSLEIDRAKHGSGISFDLDLGTAEALRRWRTICPGPLVFPSELLPGARRSRAGLPLYVEKLGDNVRKALRRAGVTRAKLYKATDDRMQFRGHDLRATYVTLALATGKTEDEVKRHTAHGDDRMVQRYRRHIETAKRQKVTWLHPLHEAIPELAAMPASPQWTKAKTAANRQQRGSRLHRKRRPR